MDMDFVDRYCQDMLAEHARLNPIEHQPETNAFVALVGIQQALREQGLHGGEVLVRQVALQGGNATFTVCVALQRENQIWGLHGARGWDEVGQVGARIQSSFGYCGQFAGLGPIEETWPQDNPPSLQGEDSAPYQEWMERCRAQLSAVLLEHRSSQPSSTRQSCRL